MTPEKDPWVEVRPDVQGGTPVVRGTRIPLSTVSGIPAKVGNTPKSRCDFGSVWENTLCPPSAARLPGKFRELPLRCVPNLRGYTSKRATHPQRSALSCLR